MSEENIILKLNKSKEEIKFNSSVASFADIDCSIYSYNGLSISINLNSKVDLNEFAQKIDLIINDNDINAKQATIVDINAETKNKSKDEIKDLIMSKLGFKIKSFANNKSTQINQTAVYELGYKNDSLSDIWNYDLMNRKKNEKLIQKQIEFLTSIIAEPKLNVAEISQAYSISRSTVSKLKNLYFQNIKWETNRKYSKINIKERHKVKAFIEDYYNNWEYPFCIKDIQNALKEEFKYDYSYQLVRDIMKNDLMLSYKRWASRSNIFNYDKVTILRKLFWIEFSKELNPDTLLANCDECSLTRNTKQNYTWSLTVFSKKINTISKKFWTFSKKFWTISTKFWIFSKKFCTHSKKFCTLSKKFWTNFLLWVINNMPIIWIQFKQIWVKLHISVN